MNVNIKSKLNLNHCDLMMTLRKMRDAITRMIKLVNPKVRHVLAVSWKQQSKYS
jgi:hypothetical protein